MPTMTQQDQDEITTATVSPSLRQWAHLPEELKIYVLCFIVGDIPESPVPDSNYTVIFRKHMEPIYEVRNKELYRLARTAYYNHNVFEICIEEKPSHLSQRVTFRYPPAEIASMIRHLRVTVKAYTMDVSRLEHILLCNSQPLAFMLQATRPLLQSNELGLPLPIVRSRWLMTAPHDNAWQTGFTNLHTLKLSFHFFDENNLTEGDEDCCMSPELIEETRACLADTKTLFKAKEVELDLTMECYNDIARVYCNKQADIIEHWKLLATTGNDNEDA